MPEVRNYIVTQVRQVEVRANHSEDAVRIAAAAFKYGQNTDSGVLHEHAPEGVWGNTSSRIKEKKLLCERIP